MGATMRPLLYLALTLLSLVPICPAALVASWNFNELAITTAGPPGSGGIPTSLAASTGSGLLLLDGWAGNLDDFAGSNLNATVDEVAGPSLSLIAGSGSPYPGNGSRITLRISLSGMRDAILSFATQSTATGFNHNQLSWSTDGSLFTAFDSPYAPGTSYAVQSFDLAGIEALDGAPDVWLQLAFDGATGASGNNRIDNLRIEAVPEPSALWLLLAAGLLALRRHRYTAPST